MQLKEGMNEWYKQEDITKYFGQTFMHSTYTGWTKKKCALKKNGQNSSEIHQKGKKLVCFGKFSINAAG